MKTKYRQSKSVQGFTLIEVLVASTILAVAVLTIVGLGRSAVRTQDIALERAQAYQLAQEGIEIVHQMRDTTAVDQIPNNGFSIFPDQALPDQAWRLAWQPTTKTWSFTQGVERMQVASPGLTFTRSIHVLPAPPLTPLTDETGQTIVDGIANNTRKVVVDVTWQSQGQDRSVSETTIFTNWNPGA